MNNLIQLRKQLAYQPFRPFWLETTGGTRIYVEKPDWFVERDFRFVVFHPSSVTFGRFSDLTELIEVEDIKEPPQ